MCLGEAREWETKEGILSVCERGEGSGNSPLIDTTTDLPPLLLRCAQYWPCPGHALSNLYLRHCEQNGAVPSSSFCITLAAAKGELLDKPWGGIYCLLSAGGRTSSSF